MVGQQAAVSLEARPCDRLLLELELQVHGGRGDADRLEGAGGSFTSFFLHGSILYRLVFPLYMLLHSLEEYPEVAATAGDPHDFPLAEAHYSNPPHLL